MSATKTEVSYDYRSEDAAVNLQTYSSGIGVGFHPRGELKIWVSQLGSLNLDCGAVELAFFARSPDELHAIAKAILAHLEKQEAEDIAEAAS